MSSLETYVNIDRINEVKTSIEILSELDDLYKWKEDGPGIERSLWDRYTLEEIS